MSLLFLKIQIKIVSFPLIQHALKTHNFVNLGVVSNISLLFPFGCLIPSFFFNVSFLILEFFNTRNKLSKFSISHSPLNMLLFKQLYYFSIYIICILGGKSKNPLNNTYHSQFRTLERKVKALSVIFVLLLSHQENNYECNPGVA